MRFEFATSNRIIFGPGTVKELGKLINQYGNKILVVTNGIYNSSQTLLDMFIEHSIDIKSYLSENDLQYFIYPVNDEPNIKTVTQGIQIAQENSCKVVVSVGGGSAIDTGKAIGAILSNGGNLMDYLEVIGKGNKLSRPSLPFIAIPTTAGTGSEVTSNAVLSSQEANVKVSLRSPYMLPQLALIDPELTYYLPPAITASTGLDALTQVIEPFVSNNTNPFTDAISKEGMRRAADSLFRAYEHGTDEQARFNMCIASLFGGICLANAKLGAVHGFAGPIGGMFHAPHGAICACLLPNVMNVNLHALQQRNSNSHIINRYNSVAQILIDNPSATAMDGIKWVSELTKTLHIPTLSSYGIKIHDFPIIIEKAYAASSMKGNSIKLTLNEMEEILTRSL